MSRWAAILAVLVLGCQPDNGTAVLLTIDGTMLDAAQRAAITELDFDVEGVESYSKNVQLMRSFSSSGRERILYQSKAKSGHLTFSVVARDSSGVEQAHGGVDADLREGETVDKTLSLGAGGPDGGEDGGGTDGGELAITPMTVSVPVTRAQQFAANRAVSWSVMEANGGDIDAGGNYYAPVLPGTYHVVATSLADSSVSATATVTATPLALKLLGGSLASPGNLDGIGAAVRFNNPTGVCSGGYYVADTGNHTIRKIDSFANNRVSTVAGNGSPGDVNGICVAAQLSSPTGIDSDGASVYIADSGNGKIKKLLLSTGAVTTFASGFIQPSDVLLDTLRNQLLVSDTSTRRIYSVSLTNPSPVPLAGNGDSGSVDNPNGLAASFVVPTSLALAFGNQLLVTDLGNLRSIDLTVGNNAAVTTLAGVSTFLGGVSAVSASYAGSGASLYDIVPRDMAADDFPLVLGALGPGWADGDIGSAQFSRINYISHDNLALTDGNVVRVLHGGASLEVQTIAGLGGVVGNLATTGVTADGAGHAWLVHGGISRVDLSSGMITDLAVTPSPSPSPPPSTYFQGLAYYQGALYATERANTIVRIDPGTGIFTPVAGEPGVGGTSDGIGTAAHMGMNGYLVSDGQGRLYVSDTQNNLIRSYDVASGMLTTIAGNPTAGSVDAVGKAASFSRPDGLALDGKGGLYVADRGNLVIRKIDLATATVTRFAGAYGQSGTTDGTLDQARFSAPWSLACDGHSLFVTSLTPDYPPAEPAVRQIDLVTGMVTHFVGSTTQQGIVPGALPASLSNITPDTPLPLGLTPAGDLLIVDFGAVLVVQSP